MTKAEVELVATAAARAVIAEHVKTCPMKYELRIQWWKLMALLASCGTLGGGVGAMLAAGAKRVFTEIARL